MARHLEETDIPISYRGMNYNISPSALHSNNLTVELPEVKVLGKRKTKGYKSVFNPNGAGEFVGTMMNSPLQLADYAFNRVIDASKGEHGKIDYRYTPVQTTAQRVGETFSPTRWIGTVKSDFKESPWSENNPGLWGDRSLDMMTDMFAIPTVKGAKFRLEYSIPRSFYKNVQPGGYSKSYLGSKVKEIKNTGKDIAKHLITDDSEMFKGDPKWKKNFLTDTKVWKEFGMQNNPEFATDIRSDAYKLYLGINDKPKYFIKNTDGTYSYDLSKIPQEYKYNFVNQIEPYDKWGHRDLLGNTGGIINKSIKRGKIIDDEYGIQLPDEITMSDVFDVHPFQNPRRAFFNKYPLIKKILTKGNDKEIKYRKFVPNSVINFEMSKVIPGAKPFKNVTTIDTNFDQIFKKGGTLTQFLQKENLL